MTTMWKCIAVERNGRTYETMHETAEQADDYADWAIGCEYIGSAYVEEHEITVAGVPAVVMI